MILEAIDMHSLKMVDIVALTAVVLSVMCPASKSTHIVTCRWIYPAVTLYFIVHARKQLENNLTCLQKIVCFVPRPPFQRGVWARD